jgi:hypothetical protein
MIITSLANEPVRSYSKADQLKGKRIKRTQRQRGAISPRVRAEVRERSKGICEVRKRCNGARSVQQAHLRGRRLIEETTADMLLDSCLECHVWLDTTAEGARYKLELRERRN